MTQRHQEGPEGPVRLTVEEIEAILAREAGEGPAPDATPPPVGLVQREPGQGKFGKWVVWLIILFVVVSAVQVIR